MILKQSFGLIVTIVNQGYADKVIDAAKSCGTEGATILKARGTGIHESNTFMGINIQPEKEVVLMIVKKQIRKKVMRAILKQADVAAEGNGLTFALPLGEIAGITHLFQEQKAEEKKERQAQKEQCSYEVEKEENKKEEKQDNTEIKKIETEQKKDKEVEKQEKAEKLKEADNTKK